MPKSKKPRHKRKVKHFLIPKSIDIAWLRENIAELELKVEIALPRGNCSDIDLFRFRDFLNWATTAAAVRTWYTEESRQEICDMLHDACLKICNLQVRGRKLGFRFTCNAEELAAIRQAFDFTGDFLRRSLEECPKQTLKEWNTMMRFSKYAAMGKPVKVDVDELINAVKYDQGPNHETIEKTNDFCTEKNRQALGNDSQALRITPAAEKVN